LRITSTKCTYVNSSFSSFFNCTIKNNSIPKKWVIYCYECFISNSYKKLFNSHRLREAFFLPESLRNNILLLQNFYKQININSVRTPK
jgi:hypothetical protein